MNPLTGEPCVWCGALLKLSDVGNTCARCRDAETKEQNEHERQNMSSKEYYGNPAGFFARLYGSVWTVFKPELTPEGVNRGAGIDLTSYDRMRRIVDALNEEYAAKAEGKQ